MTDYIGFSNTYEPSSADTQKVVPGQVAPEADVTPFVAAVMKHSAVGETSIILSNFF